MLCTVWPIAGCYRNAARLDVGPVPPGVTVNATIQYYDVTGASLAEVRREMAMQGPRADGRRWSAATSSHFKWTFRYGQPTPSVCELKHVRVAVETVVQYPRWSPSAEPDSALMEWWRQFNAGLVEHERGHAVLAVKVAGEIARELEGKSHVRCDRLGSEANAIAQRMVRQNQARQAAYDTETRHGATQIQQAGRLREP